MRIGCLHWSGNEHLGIVDAAGEYVQVKQMTPDQFFAHAHEKRAQRLSAAPVVHTVKVTDVEWLPPVPRPSKLILVAANYLEHIREFGNTEEFTDVRPQLFMKPPSTSLVGHGATVPIPQSVRWLDYEAELAVVIGDRLYEAPSEQAAARAICGYTCLNDLSERELAVDPRRDTRNKTPFFDWLGGKWMDGGAPMGPWLVTADEIDDPQNLSISLKLNGETMQSATTGQMMSGVFDIVRYASQIMTLEPGDVIATGTPAGVGRARGVRLQPGDTTEVTIERIGTLTTHFA